MFTLSCNVFQKDDNKDKNRNNLLLALALSQSSSGFLDCKSDFNAVACIPDSLTSSSKATKSLSKTVVVNDSKYTNLPQIYQPVRDTLKLSRDIMLNTAKLISNLRKIPVTSTITGTSEWANKPSKYKYSPSTKRTGGKHLEVWYNNASAPFNSLKAFEIDFKDGGDEGEVEGQVWHQSNNTDNTLHKVYVEFTYNAATKTRKSAVIINNFLSQANQLENTHFFVLEENGIAKIDGGITLSNFSPGHVGTTTIPAADRVYLYTAVGTKDKAIISIAMPLATNSTTTVFQNGDIGNISEVWTDWLLYGISSNLSQINSVCTGNASLTAPSSANPSSPEGSSAENLKACFDKILTVDSNNNVKNFYYIAATKNPAFYSFNGKEAILEAIEAEPDASYSALKSALKPSVRKGNPGDGYDADFTASAIKSINLLTGAGLSARQQWGDGSSGVNSTNGSSYNTANF
jgi:hypothetical protein